MRGAKGYDTRNDIVILGFIARTCVSYRRRRIVCGFVNRRRTFGENRGLNHFMQRVAQCRENRCYRKVAITRLKVTKKLEVFL